ncbi:hypothetical protein [Streptomyces lavendofoliae]|uniref:hypothetical protein n=1 Tax=Streptomyces lavendofoliae TaxID=67314 RepID=UPI003D93EC4A
MLETWQAEMYKYLSAMLEGCRSVIARRQPHVSGGELMGALEWTLPWGMDDGIGLVRLTVVQDRESGGWDKPFRGRVVVAAGSKGFGGSDADVQLPRYTGGEFRPTAPTVELDERDRTLTKHMADYLLERVDGEASSLREEAGGSLSFTVVLAER